MGERVLQAPLRAMADAVPVLVWATDADGRCTFVNQRWAQFTGRAPAEELGDGWLDNVHPDDLQGCCAALGDAGARKAPFEHEYRLRRADGAWRWILARAVPVLDADGGFGGFIGSGIDLTERREADEALARSREQLAAALAAGRMGAFDVNLATGENARDGNLEALYGLEPGMALTYDQWLEMVHPDDRALLVEEGARATAEGGEYRVEHRLLRPDGTLLWVERRGHAYTDAGGRIVGLRGIVVDITERKAGEEERAVLLERVTRLQAITSALAGAGAPDDVLEVMVKDGIDATGASAGSVAVLDADRGVLEIALAAGYPAALLEEFGRIALSAPLPLAETARTGAPVLTGDVDERERRYPHLATHPGLTDHRAAAAFPLLVDDRLIGAVGLSFDDPQPFDGPQVEFLGAVVAQCAQALDRAWAYSAEATARRAAEEAQARLSLLADASIVLAGSLEYETTLPQVAQLAVPLLGEGCVIDLFDAASGRGWRRVVTVGADPDLERRLLAVPPLDHRTSFADLGLGSELVLPLEARGVVLGMLAVGRESAGGFSEADRSLADGLATRIAQAIDNAGLYRAERQAHEEAETAASQLRFLLDVTTTLAAPMELRDRLDQLAHQAVGAICDLCLVDLVDQDGTIRRMAAVAAEPALQPAADALMRLLQPDPRSNHPSASAIRAERTELCPEVTEDRLRAISTSGTHLEVVRQVAPVSYVSVPLVGLSRVLGAITLITTEASGRRYGAADRLLAEDMAERVAMGLERASMHEEMRRVAQTLQASLLPSVPPAIPGLEVGTRYVAAEEGTVVGGDFFDVFAVTPGAWAVVIGDVCGQGVEAAAVTGLARHTARSAAIEHDSPATVLTHLNDVLLAVASDAGDDSDPRFCTVCLARVEMGAAGAAVTLSVGGHPLPYLLRADGAVRQVGRPGGLLGAVAGPEVVDDRFDLGPGDALVLYTDGVTERHRGTDFFGEQGIEAALAGAAGRSADEIAGAVEDAARRFVDGEPSDDMAVVVVRVPPR